MLAMRRALAPTCHPAVYPAMSACFGDGDNRDRETKRRPAPPAAGLFGEQSRADSLPFIRPFQIPSKQGIPDSGEG